MFDNLTFENYRSFQSYSMQGLKRVNLLTGFNNSGKSSLLEAIEILASGGEPECFFRISTRRSEFITADEGNASSFCDPTHFFFNRRMGRRDRMAIRSNHWWVSLMLDAPLKAGGRYWSRGVLTHRLMGKC